LEITTVKVGPALVGHGNAAGLPHNVDVITVGDHKEVRKFGLEFGKSGVDGDREEETSQRTALLTANRVHDFTQSGTWLVEEDAGWITIHEFGEAVDGGEVVQKWLPHLGPAPAVEGILGVEGTVNVTGVKFEVSRDRGRHQFTARSHAHTKLQGLGLEEEGFGIVA
jgi:hypothetical protein